MNYYKILNEKEYHHGLQYKFGLNIDPIKFNPSGDCSPGGIYFSREDTLAFLNCGPWIRKVTIPEDAQVYEDPGKPRKWKADRVILGKKEKITAKVIKRLIDEGADPKTCNSGPLDWAARNGYFEIVKVLLPYSDPKANYSRPLRSAVINNHLKIVKFLLPYSDPGALDSYALIESILNNNIKIVKILIPVSNLKVNNSEPLRQAILNDHLNIVKLLIPHSEIDNCVIDYCKRYCRNQEILNLIISNRKGTSDGLLQDLK